MDSLGEVLTLYVQAYSQTLHSIREPLSSAVHEQAESSSQAPGEKAEPAKPQEKERMASAVSRSQPALPGGAHPTLAEHTPGSQAAHAAGTKEPTAPAPRKLSAV